MSTPKDQRLDALEARLTRLLLAARELTETTSASGGYVAGQAELICHYLGLIGVPGYLPVVTEGITGAASVEKAVQAVMILLRGELPPGFLLSAAQVHDIPADAGRKGTLMQDTGYIDGIAYPDRVAVQKTAEALWAAMTSDNLDIASSRSAAYVALETALAQLLFHVYRLTAPQCDHVRDLLSEYGPDDTLDDDRIGAVQSRGIQSYVKHVLRHPRNYR